MSNHKPIYTSLNTFIKFLINRFALEHSDETIVKLHTKCIDTLKDLGLWENAEQQLIGKHTIKLFTEEQYEQLYKELEPYLLKQSKLSPKDIPPFKSNTRRKLRSTQSAFRITDLNDVQQLMLKALFFKFYKGIDFEKWNNDLQLLAETDLRTANLNQIAKLREAKTRLNEPVKSYVIPLDSES